MRNIYDVEQRFHIKGQMKDFESTSINYHLRALTADEVMKTERRYTFETFNELYDWVEGGHVLNANANSNIFGRYVLFSSGFDKYIVREKNYKEVTLWMHCQEYQMSMEQLFKLLPVTDLIEYLKENGIGVIEKRG